mmetsp:Transcript_12438/g.35988  ORF Transcript_12438/g.35988 Transcript_12438/m.35988 type:complete len:264 (+) Transcript_12438:512-1303(+)
MVVILDCALLVNGTKVSVALVEHGSALEVSKAIESKAVRGVANERAVGPRGCNVLAVSGFVVMVQGPGPDRWSDVSTTPQGDQAGVNIVTVRLRGTFDLDAIQVCADHLEGVAILESGIVVHVLWLRGVRGVRIKRKLEVLERGNHDVARGGGLTRRVRGVAWTHHVAEGVAIRGVPVRWRLAVALPNAVGAVGSNVVRGHRVGLANTVRARFIPEHTARDIRPVAAAALGIQLSTVVQVKVVPEHHLAGSPDAHVVPRAVSG